MRHMRRMRRVRLWRAVFGYMPAQRAGKAGDSGGASAAIPRVNRALATSPSCGVARGAAPAPLRPALRCPALPYQRRTCGDTALQRGNNRGARGNLFSPGAGLEGDKANE